MAKPRIKALVAQIDEGTKSRIKGMRYLRAVPKKNARAGRFLWHNFPPGDPNRILGDGGFRAWVEPVKDEARACDCGWAPHLGLHYSGRNAIRRPPRLAAD
jgi:hypothetical protein